MCVNLDTRQKYVQMDGATVVERPELVLILGLDGNIEGENDRN